MSFRPVGRLGLFAQCRGTLRGEKIALEQQFDENFSLAVGALGNLDVIAANSQIDASRAQGFRITKSKMLFTYEAKTTAEGPLVVGIAMNVTAAGIEAAIEADPQSRNADNAKGEGVFIKPLFILPKPATELAADSQRLEFEMSYGKNGWSIPEGQDFKVWVYNLGAALTSGTIVRMFAEHFGLWLRD